jgi:hypothetical protein
MMRNSFSSDRGPPPFHEVHCPAYETRERDESVSVFLALSLIAHVSFGKPRMLFPNRALIGVSVAQHLGKRAKQDQDIES